MESNALDQYDPVKAWQAVAQKQEKLKTKVLDGSKTLRIIDKKDEADLTLSVESHRWIKSNGKANFPPDEIFNAPRKSSVQGVVTFPKLPQYYNVRSGLEVSGIKLTFRDDKAVDWEAKWVKTI